MIYAIIDENFKFLQNLFVSICRKYTTIRSAEQSKQYNEDAKKIYPEYLQLSRIVHPEWLKEAIDRDDRVKVCKFII